MADSFIPRLEILPAAQRRLWAELGATPTEFTLYGGTAIALSYSGGLGLGQVAPTETVAGPCFKVAALIDVAGRKAAVVAQRAELRDYLDIHALLTTARLTLAEMLAAAAIIYGPQFDPLVALKAISYLDDPALDALPSQVRDNLVDAVRTTDPRRLPELNPVRTRARQ